MSEQSIYAKAIEALRRFGWQQNSFYGSVNEGPFCLYAALSFAEGREYRTFSEWGERLALRLGWRDCDLMNWNDAPERTVEDVMTLLKFADADELSTWRKLYGPESE